METIDQKEYTLKDKKTCEMCFEYFSVYNPRSSSKTKFICMMCNLTDKQLSTKKLELKDEKDYNESTHKYLSLNEGLMPS